MNSLKVVLAGPVLVGLILAPFFTVFVTFLMRFNYVKGLEVANKYDAFINWTFYSELLIVMVAVFAGIILGHVMSADKNSKGEE